MFKSWERHHSGIFSQNDAGIQLFYHNVLTMALRTRQLNSWLCLKILQLQNVHFWTCKNSQHDLMMFRWWSLSANDALVLNPAIQLTLLVNKHCRLVGRCIPKSASLSRLVRLYFAKVFSSIWDAQAQLVSWCSRNSSAINSIGAYKKELKMQWEVEDYDEFHQKKSEKPCDIHVCTPLGK